MTAALVSNVLYSGGFVLEKRALATLPEVTVHRPARLLRLVLGSPLWIAGALSLAAGFGAQLAVYRTLPIAAAQALFVSGLVLLVMLSARLLGEETTGRERYALGAILLALLMVVLSLKEDGAGADTVGRDAPYPVILLVCVPSLAAGVGLYWSAERRARRRHRMPTTGVEYGVAVGLLYGVSSLAIKGVSSHLTTSGIGDALLGLLRSPYPYLLLFTGAFGLVLSQAALQRCRASLIVPVCTTVTCLYTAVLGTLSFGEELPDEPLRLALRVAGTVLAVTVLLAMPKHDTTSSPGTEPGTAAKTETKTHTETDTETKTKTKTEELTPP
ncbi:DMT family transporter [Streptomyces prasinus]|uniref:DMT family transporter n=1 Tax=Streptomyces prasinus TaxID=67345 RepID=UPI00368BF635